MAGSTIDTKITHGVSLGSAGYASPLTITSAGGIAPSAAGATALYAMLGAGYVLNQGGIAGGTGGIGITGSFGAAGGTGGTGGTGVDLGGGSLVNDGVIAGGRGGQGGTGGEGIIGPGGAGGLGGTGGIGVDVTAGSLTNDGTITGGFYGLSGVSGAGGGTTIPPFGFGGIGVLLPSGGTLTNAGLIGGGFGLAGIADAVYFGDVASRLIVDPGASFSGSVVAKAASSSVLELASGARAGTLSGLGSQFAGFDNVTIDSGASWTLVSATAGVADTITDSGTLTNPGILTGLTVVVEGSLINAGTITAAGGGAGIAGSSNVYLAGGSLINTGTIVGGASSFNSGGAGAAGGVGIVAGAAGGSLTNDRMIVGGYAGNGNSGGGRGGDAVDLGTGSLTNVSGATIDGGEGGNTQYGFNSGGGGNGVDLAGGSVTNASGATIEGGNGGLLVDEGGSGGTGGTGGTGVDLTSGSLFNDGRIAGGASGTLLGGAATGDGGTGVNLAGGGLINASGAAIAGGTGRTGGIGVDVAGGSLVNASGSAITGGTGRTGGIGVDVTGGSLVNDGTITGGLSGSAYPDGPPVGAGGIGVLFQSGGTLTNAGFIAGGTGVGGTPDAVDFGTGPARLILDPGASFKGNVVADASGNNNVLELTSAGSTGTIAGLGGAVTGFGTIQFDAGAAWLIEGDNTGLAAGQAINNFGFGDTIELTGFVATGDSFVADAGLVLTGLGGSQLVDIRGSFTTSDFTVTNDGSDSFIDLNTLCFLRGTQILTDRGEVAVERLAVGDRVVTLSGRVVPIEWVGAGKVLATRGRRNAATPVIVRKGALADNVPHRDLRVTKGHSLFVGGVLVPVEFLVNHRTILWDDHAQEVEVYHVELAAHDVLLADGAPAESYRDDGNRWLFQNANSGWSLPPKAPCAPVLTGGPVVDAIWAQLLERSGARPGVVLTGDPDLHLLVNGQRLDAAQRVGDTYVFQVSAVPGSVRVMSRTVAPQELGLARDPRCLGVALRRIVVRRGSEFRVTQAADARLTDGFQAYEGDNGFRWTDGNAGVPIAVFAGFTGAMEVLLTVTSSEQYVEDGCRRAAA